MVKFKQNNLNSKFNRKIKKLKYNFIGYVGKEILSIKDIFV